MAPGDQPARLDDCRRSHLGRSLPSATSADDEKRLRGPRRPLGSTRSPVRGERLNRYLATADSFAMSSLETSTVALRDRALALAAELGIDQGTWYLRVLEEGRAAGEEPDLGALVRTYWELQRVTGRDDLRTDWRSLADYLWSTSS
jgi:hypothetical protein